MNVRFKILVPIFCCLFVSSTLFAQQMEDSSKQQSELLQAQIQKLETLVSTTEDNTRSIEKIAYSLG